MNKKGKPETALQSAECYYSEDSNSWYLKLEYEYIDSLGKHSLIFPKVFFPLPQYGNPSINDWFSRRGPTIDVVDTPYLCKDDVKDPRNGKAYNGVYFVDILTEPVAKKMTLSEIEKKLGYKIELVSEATDGKTS